MRQSWDPNIVVRLLSFWMMEGKNTFWLNCFISPKLANTLCSSCENQSFTLPEFSSAFSFSFSPSCGLSRHFFLCYSIIPTSRSVPSHLNPGFLLGMGVFSTSPTDLNTFTMSYSRRILVLTRAELSVWMSTRAASSRLMGSSVETKSLRKRAARFSRDFSFLLEWVMDCESKTVEIVATACCSPRQM